MIGLAKNLVEVKVPQLEKWVPSGSLRFNVRAAVCVEGRLGGDCKQKGLLGHVVSFGGAFVPADDSRQRRNTIESRFVVSLST